MRSVSSTERNTRLSMKLFDLMTARLPVGLPAVMLGGLPLPDLDI